jgi:hypothetical protein
MAFPARPPSAPDYRSAQNSAAPARAPYAAQRLASCRSDDRPSSYEPRTRPPAHVVAKKAAGDAKKRRVRNRRTAQKAGLTLIFWAAVARQSPQSGVSGGGQKAGRYQPDRHAPAPPSAPGVNDQAVPTVGAGRRLNRYPGLTITLAGNCKNSGLLKSSIILSSDDAKIVNQRPRWN